MSQTEQAMTTRGKDVSLTQIKRNGINGLKPTGTASHIALKKERVYLSRQRTEASIALSLKAKTGRQADQRKRIKAGSLEGSKEATNQKLIKLWRPRFFESGNMQETRLN